MHPWQPERLKHRTEMCVGTSTALALSLSLSRLSLSLSPLSLSLSLSLRQKHELLFATKVKDVNGVVWFELQRKKAHLFYMRMDFTDVPWKLTSSKRFGRQASG